MAGTAYIREIVPGSVAGLRIESILINPTSTTAVAIEISKVNMTLEPTVYTVTYGQYNASTGALIGTTTMTNYPVSGLVASKPVINISSLTAGAYYKFFIFASRNSQVGDVIGDSITLSDTLTAAKIVSGSLSPAQISPSKSFLTMTAPAAKNEFAIATKTFSAISMPSFTTSSIGSNFSYAQYWATDEQISNYDTAYFAMGTSLFMDSIITSPKQGAGIGFFTNSEGTRGYFLVVESTALSASQDRKSIRFVKIDGTKVFTLQDSQKTAGNIFEGVYGGTQYNIDIKVKVENRRVDVIAYINGFKITAYDEFSYNEVLPKYTLPVTQNVSLICSTGTAAFDYVYGTSITDKAYADTNYTGNVYNGQFANDFLQNSYGDTLYNSSYTQDIVGVANSNTIVDEFGTTVREIAKATVKFPSRPSFPIKWSTGSNRLVKILGSKMSSFGGEAFVLNNTSTTIPLSDNNMASLYIFGNTLSPSGQLEYATDESSSYTTSEPVTFQSKWIQTEADAKSLGDWIKSKVVNKGKVVTMTIFGNPLLSVGNIVSINYPYQGFDGTQKFIVTNVSHTYNDGLETTVACRLIAS